MSNPFPIPRASRGLTIVAWAVTLLISVVPDIVWIELVHASPVWFIAGKMGLLAVLALAAIAWRPLRPLRNFFLAMLAFFALFEASSRINFTIPALQGLFGGNVFDVRMQAEQTGKLAVALAMIAVLLVLGFKRRDLFLTLGNLRAPIEPVRLLGFPKPDSWMWFGLQWGFYIAAGLAAVQYFGMRPMGALLLKLVPVLPSVLFYAALNAFNEEATFRVPMLASLEPVAGSKQALWMGATFFGVAHYFGVPGGLVGVVLSIFMGWILSKAMLETRGLFWSWWIHFLSDVVIFAFLALALLK
jgi:hypothetical protein